MARRYTYSRTINTIEGVETFTAQEWDSFDEAQAAVEKGIYQRKDQLKQKYPGNALGGVGQLIPPGGPVGSPTAAPKQVGEAADANAKGPAVPSGNNTAGHTGAH